MKIVIGLVAVLAIFLLYVASKPSAFSFERSGLIQAPPEKIYPYLSQLSLGGQWSPYEKKDLGMKKTFEGTDGTPGAKMSFDGNSEVGAGHIEILNMVPQESVELKLTMTRPMKGENNILYSLTKEGDATRFTWKMSGDWGFPAKIFSVFVDCEQMIAKDFEVGIQNLKTLVETNP